MTNRRDELARIFERASKERTNIIDPPFDCVTLNLKPKTCAEIAALLRAGGALDAEVAAAQKSRC